MSVLVLVAHPDDELLFASSVEGECVALTAGPRADRFPGTVLGFADEWRILHRREYVEWRHAVQDLRLRPEIVVTHNRMGDYGHPHHMAVNAIARELFPVVWEFWNDAPSSVGPQWQGERTWTVPVDKAERFEATYPGVYDELAADKPELIAALFTAEGFTAGADA